MLVHFCTYELMSNLSVPKMASVTSRAEIILSKRKDT